MKLFHLAQRKGNPMTWTVPGFNSCTEMTGRLRLLSHAKEKTVQWLMVASVWTYWLSAAWDSKFRSVLSKNLGWGALEYLHFGFQFKTYRLPRTAAMWSGVDPRLLATQALTRWNERHRVVIGVIQYESHQHTQHESCLPVTHTNSHCLPTILFLMAYSTQNRGGRPGLSYYVVSS